MAQSAESLVTDPGYPGADEAQPRVITVIPFLTKDELPSEALNAVSGPGERTMPWGVDGPLPEGQRSEDEEMAERLECLVSEVNDKISASEEDPSLAKVGVVGGSASVKAKSLPPVGKTQADHWAALSEAWNKAEAEAQAEGAQLAAEPMAPVADMRPRRLGFIARLLGRKAPAPAPVNPDEMMAHKIQSFDDRVRRIEKGRQWQPDGVVHAVGRRRNNKAPFGQRPNVRFGVFMMLITVVGVVVIGPEEIEGYVQIAVDAAELDSWSVAQASEGLVNVVPVQN